MVLEIPQIPPQNHEYAISSAFYINKFSLESNCNNELINFQFDPMPSCDTDNCDKLWCKPLSEIGLDVAQMDKSSFTQLGQGSFNVVYDITYDKKKPIVLRLLKPALADYKTIKQEQNGLVYQTRISKSIKEGGYGCPYIAKVYDFGIYNNKSVYAILEKCNMDLFDKMSELYGSGQFSEQQLINITKQTLEALHCLHEHNIYHLDLKTENIMFNDVVNISDIKLIDFGAAIQSQGPEKDILSSKRYGTPGYTSPAKLYRVVGLEKLNILNSPNAMDDLWSLGMTLMKLIFMAYQMTTKGEYFFAKFPHNPNVVPRNYYDYDADVLVPTAKAYAEIQQTTIPNLKTGYSNECVTFLKRIFDTVSIEHNRVLLKDSYFTLSAKDLLEDPWLNNTGGKRRTNRKNKKNTKVKKQKSKNTKTRVTKKH